MTKLQTLKDEARAFHQNLRDTDAFDRFGRLYPERQADYEQLEALWAVISEREAANAARAHHMREVAYARRHGLEA